jgi:hypothetical protein
VEEGGAWGGYILGANQRSDIGLYVLGIDLEEVFWNCGRGGRREVVEMDCDCEGKGGLLVKRE